MAIAYSLVAPRNGIIVIDRTRSADPINYKFWLKIKNQGTTEVYYKLTETSGAWSIVSPTGGELGSVGSGSATTKAITLQRALPTSDIVEPIDLILEAYSDSGYTNLIESVNFSLTAILADIHSWPSYTKYDFDDGTTQGWTITKTSGAVTVSDQKSITPGGYSIRLEGAGGGVHITYTLTKTEVLPSNSRVVLAFYINMSGYNYSTIALKRVRIKINGETVYQIGEGDLLGEIGTSTWDVFCTDLSNYAGQSVTLDIELYGIFASGKYVYIDDIIIAGTDAL